jgi:hypothetical protein
MGDESERVVKDVNGRKYFRPPQTKENAPSLCTSRILCSVCGKPEDDAKHIKWGPDLDNPVKHFYTPNASLERLPEGGN